MKIDHNDQNKEKGTAKIAKAFKAPKGLVTMIMLAATAMAIGAEAQQTATAEGKGRQTNVSLFMKKDKAQRAVIDTSANDMYKTIGHHGPAVENSMMALRIYCKAGCAIDVYSKTKPELELTKYGWYPTQEQIESGAGCDEYRVGKTTGLGGFGLWDGEKTVPLTSTNGRRIEATTDDEGAQISMTVRGVEYKGEKIDVKLSVRVTESSRVAEIEAECISGQKVVFVSGINFHPGQTVVESENGREGRMATWGVHPADIVANPLPIGGGLVYDAKVWQQDKIDTANGFLPIKTRKAVKRAKVRVVAACQREGEVNDMAKFMNLVQGLSLK